MLILHHMAASLYSQRVRLVLAEKDLTWQSALVAPAMFRDPAYLGLNPAGVVPTLEHDGHVFVESRIICEYLEDAFPWTPMIPANARDRYTVRRWAKICDDDLYMAVFVLTFMTWMRGRYLDLSPEARVSALPGLADPVKRRVAQDLVDRGWDSHIIPIALGHVVRTIDRLDEALEELRWLGGEHYSFADCDLLAAVQRIDDLGLSPVWDERARVAGWFDRARSRPSFDTAIAAWRDEETSRRQADQREAVSERFAGVLASVRE
ncbi:glutathione S-transferase family protein [soil metagenome]